MQHTRQRILEYLRARGSGTVEVLAAEVGLAPVTVRHHLGVLRHRELVVSDTESVGRGRPRHVYSLSSQGAELLIGDGYQTLASKLLDEFKREDPSRAERFFRGMADRIVEGHRVEYEGKSIGVRMDTVVSLLAAEGFTLQWEPDDGDYLVRAIGCPYSSLGSDHIEVCCLDLQVIARVTGGDVRRESWRQAGDGECVFRVFTD